MKNKTIWATVMTVLSAFAVMLAYYPASVTVFHPGDETAMRYSFFQEVPGAPIAMCLLFAGILSCVALMLSVIYLASKRSGWLKGVIWVSFISATLAVIPIVARLDPVVLPNIAHPVAMGTVSLLGYLLSRSTKTSDRDHEPKGERLSPR